MSDVRNNDQQYVWHPFTHLKYADIPIELVRGEGAFFIDGGNIWTMKSDTNRWGSQFSSNWFKEIAISPGIGLRRDFDYFILRVDLGFPIHDPALPNGERWIFQKHEQFNNDVTTFMQENPLMPDGTTRQTPRAFIPRFSFGIGYPF